MTRILLLAIMSIFVLSCATPQGFTEGEQRDYIETMRTETLKKLYMTKPEAEDKISKAPGYAVFSNVGSYIVYLSTGNGYGVVVNRSSGDHTYMKMLQVGAGLGLGIKDFRLVMIFKNEGVMNDFVEKGWEFGGQADAAAKSDDKGGAVGGEIYIDQDIVIYQITEAGVALQATVAGTKYWKDKDLN